MKKFIAMLLAAIMVVGVLAGCNQFKPTKTEPTNDQTDQTQATEATNPTDSTIGSKDPTQPSDETQGILEMSDICYILYSIIEVNPMPFSTMVMDVDLTDQSAVSSYTGLENADDIKFAAICKAMEETQAYFVALVKVKDWTKADEIAQKMHDGIDIKKWDNIDADDVRVATTGDMVLLVVIDAEYADDCTAQDMIDVFATKCGKLSTTISK